MEIFIEKREISGVYVISNGDSAEPSKHTWIFVLSFLQMLKLIYFISKNSGARTQIGVNLSQRVLID